VCAVRSSGYFLRLPEKNLDYIAEVPTSSKFQTFQLQEHCRELPLVRQPWDDYYPGLFTFME
jgi:hypothetical protein